MDVDDPSNRLHGTLGSIAGLVGTLLLFLLAVRLLGTATEAATPLIEGLLAGGGSALGIDWLATYGIANGSVVVALAVSLASAGVVSTAEPFLPFAGSRLGSAAAVVLLGAIDYHYHRESTFVEATGLGFFAFVLTVYVPATALGSLAMPWALSPLADGVRRSAPSVGPVRSVEPLTAGSARTLGPVASVGLALGLLVASLWLFDRLLARVETASVRRRVLERFERPWRVFALGLALTALTTSVTFSTGVAAVLLLAVSTLLVTAAAMATFPWYLGAVGDSRVGSSATGGTSWPSRPCWSSSRPGWSSSRESAGPPAVRAWRGRAERTDRPRTP